MRTACSVGSGRSCPDLQPPANAKLEMDPSLSELRHRPLAFVEDLDAPVLDDADRHHLDRSLRLRPGDALTVGDGQGRWRAVRFGIDLEADGPIGSVARRTVPVTVAFSPVKGDRSDLVVQKLTELGIDRIVPVTTERSVVRWDDARAAKHRQRHTRIVREAAMQSRTLWLPRVELLTAFEPFVAEHDDAVLADPMGGVCHHPPSTVMIGPEGGFSSAELAGRATMALPGGVLRTETAAITAAVAVLLHLERDG